MNLVKDDFKDNGPLGLEYSAARNRIDKDIDAINSFENYSMVAIGALLNFSLSKDGEKLFFPAMITIMIISLYGIIRYTAIRKSIFIAEQFIKTQIEPRITDLTGPMKPYIPYMSYYDNEKNKSSYKYFLNMFCGGFLKKTRYLMWLLSLILPLILIFIRLDAPLLPYLG